MSAHTPGPWSTEHGLIYCAEGRTVASCIDDEGEFVRTHEGPHDARLIAVAPRLADALLGLLVALGKHTADMTPAQLADICPACDEATAALIEAGSVMG